MERKGKEIKCRENNGKEVIGGKRGTNKERRGEELDLFQNGKTRERKEEARAGAREKGDTEEAEW